MKNVKTPEQGITFSDLSTVLRNHNIAPVVASNAHLRNTCHALHAIHFIAKKKYGMHSVREVILPEKIREVFVDFVNHLKALDASLEISISSHQ